MTSEKLDDCFHKVDKINVKRFLPIGLNELKDTHSGKAPSNKTPALIESRNMSIWVVGTSNQLFIIGT